MTFLLNIRIDRADEEKVGFLAFKIGARVCLALSTSKVGLRTLFVK